VQEKAAQQEVSLVEFQPPELPEEEAIQKDIEESELLALSRWEGLPVLLR
jgi:hypothetical protein